MSIKIDRSARGHSIDRTSPKGPGQKFIGTCRLCGTAGLTFANLNDECPNQRGLSQDEALLEVIEPPEDQT